MSDSDFPDNVTPDSGSDDSFSSQLRIAPICDAFEEAWKQTGVPPDLREFLSRGETRDRRQLASELVLLDRHYGGLKGFAVTHEHYQQEFPELVDAIELAFGQPEQTILSSRTNPNVELETLYSASESRQSVSNIAGKKVHYFGDYELVDEIARGGMGVVYRARQISLNRMIALKMILSGQIAGDDAIRRFQFEAEAAANLDHPGIVPIYDIGEHDGQHYFSMKLIEGKTLTQIQHEFSLDHRRAIELVSQVADATHHAHQRGILHRDLKPGNILVDEGGQPLVTDFGLARDTKSDQQHTASGAVIGTPGFMSPEQAAGKAVTTATDIYSLGAILYQLLCGQPPHQGDTVMATLMSVMNDQPKKPRNLNPNVAPDLELICLKCLEKDPDKRYASAAEFAGDLRAFASGHSLRVRAPSIIELARMWLASNYGSVVWVPIIALVVGICSGVSIWLLTYGGRSGEWDSVYSNFPAEYRPTITFERVRSIDGTALPTLFLILTTMGWATARLVKTKTSTADWGAGLGVGLLAGLLAFACGAGAPLIDSQSSPEDMMLVFELAGSPNSVASETALLDRYPTLSGQSRHNQAALLTNKIAFDQCWSLTSGVWFATLFCLALFGTVGAVETWVAGPLVRLQKRVAGFLSYLCFTLALNAIAIIIAGEVWVTFIAGAGMILDWTAPLLCIMFASLAMISVIAGWRWYVKLPMTIAWVAMYVIFMSQNYEEAGQHSVATSRGAIARAERLVERDSTRRDYAVKLAQGHYDFSIALRDRKRFDQSLTESNIALDLLLAGNPPEQLSLPERELYSALLYWSGDTALKTGEIELAADRSFQHLRFFPYSSRFVSLLYGQSALSLGTATDLLDYIQRADKNSPDQWRKVINQINILTQYRQSLNSFAEPISKDSWRRELVEKVLDRASADVADDTWKNRSSVLRKWMLSEQRWELFGPFRIKADDSQIQALDQMYGPEAELLEAKSEFSAELVKTCLPQTQINLATIYDEHTNVVAYARTTLEIIESQVITFRLGMDDLHMIWIDGKPVNRNVGIVGISEGRQSFDVNLKKGTHTLLVKITQGEGEWGFVIDAADSNGWPVPIWSRPDGLVDDDGERRDGL